MLKSISAWAFDPNRPLAEVFKLAKETGFEGVEVAIGEEGELTFNSTQAQCQAIVDQAAAAGITIGSVASGLGWKYHLTSVDEAARKEAVDVTSRCLQVSRYLGVDAMLVVPGGAGSSFNPDFPVTPYQAAYDNTLKSLDELKGALSSTGVSIGIENVWNMFLFSPIEMRDFIDKVNNPLVGVYFDVGNIIITGYAEHWIDILGPRIKKIHFKDFKRSFGTLDGFCDLLDGDVNYPAVMKSLRAAGYDGPVTSEFFNAEADLPKISAAMDKIAAM